MKQISIITNKKVDKTIKGEDCLLLRQLMPQDVINNTKKYITLFYRVNYIKEVIDGEEVQTLVFLDKRHKDSETVDIFSFEELNDLYENIKSEIPDSIGEMEKDILKEKLGFLQMTKIKPPYGTLAEDWELI